MRSRVVAPLPSLLSHQFKNFSHVDSLSDIAAVSSREGSLDGRFEFFMRDGGVTLPRFLIPDRLFFSKKGRKKKHSLPFV